jgi:polyphosphate glucokinase
MLGHEDWFPTAKADLAMKVLAIDVGGTHVKILVPGERDHREFPSGRPASAKSRSRAIRAKRRGDL